MQLKHRKSFTLVEIIIVITVIGILSTIGFSSYNGFRDRFAFEKDFRTVQKFLSNARELAFTGAKVEGTSYTYLGLVFEDSKNLSFFATNDINNWTSGVTEKLNISEKTELSLLVNQSSYISQYPTYIYYLVNEKGVNLVNNANNYDSMTVIFQDSVIASRTKGIYLNTLSGTVESLEASEVLALIPSP